MGKFAKGLFTGIAVTVGAAAAAASVVKKTVIDPIDEKEKFIDENRKKAARKRVSR